MSLDGKGHGDSGFTVMNSEIRYKYAPELYLSLDV